MDSFSGGNLNAMEATWHKLTSSLNQYAASSLASVILPEFKGAPNEDVHDFLCKFKKATATFNDELKCLALQKALSGAAQVWAKHNLKVEFNVGDWKTAKSALIERFGPPNLSPIPDTFSPVCISL